MSRKIREYTTEHIKVTYDAKRCIHAAECVKRLSAVFDPDKRRSWIHPENASPAELSETICHCPTGALHFERLDGGQPEWPDTENTVALAPDGPLYARGQIQIVKTDGSLILQDTRVALCRCGASEDKPFCDGKHAAVGFQDPGEIQRAPAEQEPAEHAPLVVTVQPNGPLRLSGPFRVLPQTAEASIGLVRSALCRCGHSARKPFCDGAHKAAGFQGD